jgi:hypothetical protein
MAASRDYPRLRRLPIRIGVLQCGAGAAQVAGRAGISGMFAGQAILLAVLHLTAPRPSGWYLVGPLALAGLGNGMVIGPNQDFVLGSVPRRQAGTAGGMLYTAQRIGAAIGIALFGSGSGGKPGAIDAHLVSTAQLATIVNLGFILAAFACGLALPRTLGAERADENR